MNWEQQQHMKTRLWTASRVKVWQAVPAHYVLKEAWKVSQKGASTYLGQRFLVQLGD